MHIEHNEGLVIEEPQMSETMEDSLSSELVERKRKRDSTDAPELEIDVSLPEPPSKKALRKAKKSKSEVNSEEGPTNSNGDAVDEKNHIQENGISSEVTKSELNPNKRTEFGIWIGNLPWSMDKKALRSFFINNSEIQDHQIMRIHMPAPRNAVSTKTQLKPQNKGFAYVDFDTNEVMYSALALSETPLGGRNVLIKNAKSFEGRPEGNQASQTDRKGTEMKQRTPSKKIFVGNLGFDVTKEDLNDHFNTCGDVEDIHMATFEDSGKCKGYAWVSFSELEAAEAAVRGWVILQPQNDEIEDELENQVSDAVESKRPLAKKPRGRKWFVNRLAGRSLRCEFAEDSTTRYKKRFGKDPSQLKYANGDEDGQATDISGVPEQGDAYTNRRSKDHPRIQPGAPTDPTKRRGKVGFEPGSKSTEGSGKSKALEESRYRTGVITEGTGTKVSFG